MPVSVHIRSCPEGLSKHQMFTAIFLPANPSLFGDIAGNNTVTCMGDL
jgi:hypothetical protein